jgi:predicted molibdopterin-dependent oxidoreductase YjgC
VPRLLKELDGLLAGDDATGIIYQGRDCNSRGASVFAGGEVKDNPDLLLLFGVDHAGCAPQSSELRQRMSDAATVVTFDSFLNETVMAADAVFPLPHAAEKEGTFIACNGLAQKVNRAMEPPAGVSPLWDHLDLLAESLGKSLSFAPSLIAGTADESDWPARDAGLPAPAADLPASGEKHLLLRGIRVADHRLRLVPETAMLMPPPAVEINPADLSAYDLAGGEKVRLLSGEAALEVEARADLKVPRGQIHFPFDPADATARSFVEKADRPKGWPAVCIRLSSMEKTEPGGGS